MHQPDVAKTQPKSKKSTMTADRIVKTDRKTVSLNLKHMREGMMPQRQVRCNAEQGVDTGRSCCTGNQFEGTHAMQ